MIFNPTENPSEDAIDRSAMFEFSEGQHMTTHLYDCVRNPDSLFGKAFKHMKFYRFLKTYSLLIESGSVNLNRELCGHLPNRCMRTKKEKRSRETRKK